MLRRSPWGQCTGPHRCGQHIHARIKCSSIELTVRAALTWAGRLQRGGPPAGRGSSASSRRWALRSRLYSRTHVWGASEGQAEFSLRRRMMAMEAGVCAIQTCCQLAHACAGFAGFARGGGRSTNRRPPYTCNCRLQRPRGGPRYSTRGQWSEW